MGALNPPAPTHSASIARRETLLSALAFLALGVLLRLQFAGNPIQHIDEQFYLLVADRMREGALPYVDIWDRKPIGLFLVYRLALFLPLDPVLAVQALGLASAVATALVIERLALRIAPQPGGRLAGVAYIAMMPVFGNGYAQAPVFYNLPVALAVLLAVDAAPRDRDPALPARALGVMALLGIAIQLKYTVVFEGAGLGLLLLWRAWQDRMAPPRLATLALACIAMALLPTALVWAWYVQIGHGAEFVFANFVSIFAKTKGANKDLLRVLHVTLILSPLLVGVLLGPPSRKDPDAHWMLRWWGLCAFIGFVAFGRWYDHYLGPLLSPLAVLAAPLLAEASWFRRLVLAIAFITNVVVFVDHQLDDGTSEEARRAAAAISAELPTDRTAGCLYQYQGHSALYRLTGACLATRFIFPDHLATYPEAKAIGVDPTAEVRRIMASRPAVVLLDNAEHPYMPNLETRAILNTALRRAYESRGELVIGKQHLGFWVLKR